MPSPKRRAEFISHIILLPPSSYIAEHCSLNRLLISSKPTVKMGLILFMFGGLLKFELGCCEKRLRAHLSLNVSSAITPSPAESASCS